MDLDNTQPSSSEDSVNIGVLVRSLSKHWLIICVVAGAVVTLTAFVVLAQTKIYSASTTLKIEPTALRPLGKAVEASGDSYSMYWANKEYYATQYRLLESRSLAEEVVSTLALNTDVHFIRNKPDSEAVEPLEHPVSIEDAAFVLLQRLKIAPEEKTRLVTLEYEDASPERAHRIVSTIARAYMERNLSTSIDEIGNAGAWLDSQLGELKDELEAKEMALHNYKRKNNLVSASLDDQSNMLRSEMEDLNSALTTARARREGLAARVNQLSKVGEDNPAELPAQELLESKTLADLRAVYVQALTETESLIQSGKGEQHPDVLRATATRDASRDALLDEVKNIKRSAQKVLAAADQEIAGLRSLYRESERRAFDLNLLEIEFKRLARSKDNTERLHTIVLERAKESELNGRMRFNNVSVVDAALVPSSPVYPRIPLTLALGGILGIGLGCALALLRERLDQRLQTSADVELHLGMLCVGSVPSLVADTAPTAPRPIGRRKSAENVQEAQAAIHIHENPKGNAAEAVRALRTNLLFMSPDKPFSKILITSAAPSDGKTTIVCSLAITLAQSGKTVILIDADLRRPRLSAILGPGGFPRGVTTAVIAPDTLATCIVDTGIPNVSLLPTGPLPPNPAELLHSTSFERLVERLDEQFDYVLIDSPPLMAVTDAAILSRIAETTLLVVRAGKTRKDQALKARKALRDVRAPVAGVILNGVNQHNGGYGYYDYYGETKPNETSLSAT